MLTSVSLNFKSIRSFLYSLEFYQTLLPSPTSMRWVLNTEFNIKEGLIIFTSSGFIQTFSDVNVINPILIRQRNHIFQVKQPNNSPGYRRWGICGCPDWRHPVRPRGKSKHDPTQSHRKHYIITKGKSGYIDPPTWIFGFPKKGLEKYLGFWTSPHPPFWINPDFFRCIYNESFPNLPKKS